MKKIFLVLLVLIIAALCAACSNGPADVQPPTDDAENDAAVSDEAPPGEENEEFDADAWFLYHWWSLNATVEQNDEVGEVFGAPGMYADYTFTISLINGLYDEDPSVTGSYLLDVESTILFNSDEFADKVASEMTGIDVSGLGLGVSVVQTGSYTNSDYFDEDGNYVYVDSSNMQNVSKNWHSLIKDKNGQVVQPAEGSYMVFEEFNIEYEGSGGNLLYGTVEGVKTETAVLLFVVVEPDMPGVDIDLSDRHVKVYINYPDWDLNGREIWLEGEGTLVIKEDILPISD